MITSGGLECVYPNPTAVSGVSLTDPFVIVVVANAVEPMPVVVTEPIGGLIEILCADKYPEPAFVISIEIVPAAETIAVAEAPTLIYPDVIKASNSNDDKL